MSPPKDSKKGGFFDSFDDYKRVSDLVDAQQGHFVACWPPPRDAAASDKDSGSDSSSENSDSGGEDEEGYYGSRPLKRRRSGRADSDDDEEGDIEHYDAEEVAAYARPPEDPGTGGGDAGEAPVGAGSTAAAAEGGGGWTVVPDAATGDSYFWNTVTGEVTWDRPAELAAAAGAEACGSAPPGPEPPQDGAQPEPEGGAAARGDEAGTSKAEEIEPPEPLDFPGRLKHRYEAWRRRADETEVVMEPDSQLARKLIDKTAKFVAEKPEASREMVERSLLKQGDRFTFLGPADELHPYYCWQIGLAQAALL